MAKRTKALKLEDTYCFPGFRPKATIKGIVGDPKARVITLQRREKKRLAVPVAKFREHSTTKSSDTFGISPAETFGFIWTFPSVALLARFAAR